MTNPPDPPKWVQTMSNVPLYVGLIANSWAKLEHAIVPMANKLLRTADDTQPPQPGLRLPLQHGLAL